MAVCVQELSSNGRRPELARTCEEKDDADLGLHITRPVSRSGSSVCIQRDWDSALKM